MFDNTKWQREYKRRPEVKAKRREYLNRPEVRERVNALARAPARRAQRREYINLNREQHNLHSKLLRRQPKHRAKSFATQHGIDIETVLPWYEIPLEHRTCWLCGDPGVQLSLDHNHETKNIRGWTHYICNTVEGMVMACSNPQALLRSLAKQCGSRPSDTGELA